LRPSNSFYEKNPCKPCGRQEEWMLFPKTLSP
jgi:hypothetical protein